MQKSSSRSRDIISRNGGSFRRCAALQRSPTARTGLESGDCLPGARRFGTTPQFWMNMQSKVDIWDSLALHEDEVMAIEPIEIAAIA